MRLRSLKLAALCLLLLSFPAFWPAPTAPQQVRSMQVGPAVDWTPLASAIQAQTDWYAALPPPTTTTTTVRRSGTVGAAAMDGDRFDRLAQCESGGDPAKNTGNGFYGAFQFVLSTWHAAGGTGNPIEHSYAEQKQIAIAWATRSNPYTQWPVCWPRTA